MIRWDTPTYLKYIKKRGGAASSIIKQIQDQAPKENKYKNKKVIHDGITFDSVKEGNYYLNLKLMTQQNLIQGFELQPRFELQPGYIKGGKKIRAIYYIADFKITHKDGSIEIIDTKGVRTKEFNIKKKILEFKYPDINLKLV